jgi:hypothetical protein
MLAPAVETFEEDSRIAQLTSVPVRQAKLANQFVAIVETDVSDEP